MRAFVLCALFLLVAAPAATASRVVVDDFENVSGWSANPADGVELAIAQDDGVHGKSLRLDFNFVRGGGYAVARKSFSLALPSNYRFHFAVRGDTKPQDLEFKLIDSTGSNVWWMNRRGFAYPAKWDSLTTKKRQIEFAWGPIGGGEIRHVAAIEIAITAGSGGKGTVWLDDLTLEELPPAGGPQPIPVATGTSSQPGAMPKRAVDGRAATAWRPLSSDPLPTLTVNYGVLRELSAIELTWLPRQALSHFVVEQSDDGTNWRSLREVVGGDGGQDLFYLPETELRFLRIRALEAQAAGGIALSELALKDPSWAKTENDFFGHIARAARRGLYPRGMRGEQSYWTVIGADRDAREALIDEDGRIEPWKAGPSIEPFLLVGGKLVTWADVRTTHSLAEGDLPIPTVTWTRGDLALQIEAFVDGLSRLRVRYRVENRGKGRQLGTLGLAIRPFQVNPPSQFLNTIGGVAPLRGVRRVSRQSLVIDDRPPIALWPAPEAMSMRALDRGDVAAEFVEGGPASGDSIDPAGRASVFLRYPFDLAAGQSSVTDLATSLPTVAERGSSTAFRAPMDMYSPFDAARETAQESWRAKRGQVEIDILPSGRDAITTLHAQLAYARITRDSVALMPGSRSYERSWIRDGALSANAFLRMGQPDVAKDFARWFARFVPENGAVPCCVDHRGADPTPEHDSHGEFVYLVAEILRYTGDLGLARDLWPAARRAADHIDTLRAQRRTPEWRNTEFFGLLPPSISHEGYSAKPMHSYWDDFFGLRGLADATYLAERLGHADDARRFAASRDEFARDLKASIAAAQKKHNIDFVPGCADLGDFDATSTTIVLDPVDAEDVAGKANLDRTFDLYWKHFTNRRDGPQTWKDYTPYETRTIGALARLGFRQRANEALTYFLKDRRPKGFMHWAEVVGRDYRKPRFIGDMPHTWVGTDYVRSVIDLFAYTRGADSALVVGSGLPYAWIGGFDSAAVRVQHSTGGFKGVQVKNLPTPFGSLTFRMWASGSRTICEIESGMRVPEGGIIVAPPTVRERPWRNATINGQPANLGSDDRVIVRSLPARVVFTDGSDFRIRSGVEHYDRDVR